MDSIEDKTLTAKIYDRIVKNHNIAYIITDENLAIKAHNSVVWQWLDPKQRNLIGLSLTDIFKELSRYSETLSQIARNEHCQMPPGCLPPGVGRCLPASVGQCLPTGIPRKGVGGEGGG